MDLLRALRIDTVFGNPGSTELPFLGSWPNDMRYVLGLQEASVVAMADGFAQATRNAAFVNLHSAAGVGHALGNLHTAFRNQTPMVITAGQQVRELLPLHPFLFAEQAAEFPKPYVKWSIEPARAADVPGAIAQAYRIAMQKPCGPTFVSIPIDDWDAPAATPPVRVVSTDVAPDPALLGDVATAIDRAERLAFVVGAAVDAQGTWDATVALAERCGAAVWVAPFSARASFPEDHPLFQGFLPAAPGPVGETLAAYDTIVVIGAPVFTFHVAGRCALFERDVALFQLTDDPGMAARAAIGTSVVGSLRLALPALADLVAPGRRAPPPSRPTTPEAVAAHPIPAEFLMQTLARAMPVDGVLVEEVPSHRPAMQRHLPIRKPNSFYTMASGGLGWALPASVGIALADPTRRVTCLIGDGSVMYSLQALWTAVQHGLPVTVVVVNNGGYGAMRAFSQVLGAIDPPGIDLPGLDFVHLAAGMGCPGRRIERAADLPDALRAGQEAAGPCLVEVVVDPAIPHLYAKAKE
jgi:benzoylformate decarboxylase